MNDSIKYSSLKCDTCKVKPGTEPCHSCPDEQALIAALQKELDDTKKVMEKLRKQEK